MDMSMELPMGIELESNKKGEYVLKLLANLYGQKQAGCMCNEYLGDKLQSLVFKQSQINERVFYHDDMIFIVYVDDGLFLGPSDGKLEAMIKAFQETGSDIEDQGHPSDYVGVNIKKHHDGSYEFSQLALIDSILDDVGLNNSRKAKPVSMFSLKHLYAHAKSKPFYKCDRFQFNYCSVILKLNYIAQTTRPDIILVVHQLA